MGLVWFAMLLYIMVWDAVYFRQTEEINQALEDNQVKLSTMKASRFVKAFEHEVDKWERALSLIMEIVEMLLTVQRQWMYLEVCVYCVCVTDGPATVDVLRGMCVLCLCYWRSSDSGCT